MIRASDGKHNAPRSNAESPLVTTERDGRPVLWDPVNAWPAGRKWIWAAVVTLMIATQGPTFVRSIRTSWRTGMTSFRTGPPHGMFSTDGPPTCRFPLPFLFDTRLTTVGHCRFRRFTGTLIRPRPFSRFYLSVFWLIQRRVPSGIS